MLESDCYTLFDLCLEHKKYKLNSFFCFVSFDSLRVLFLHYYRFYNECVFGSVSILPRRIIFSFSIDLNRIINILIPTVCNPLHDRKIVLRAVKELNRAKVSFLTFQNNVTFGHYSYF